jgi:hypothetical protein
MAEEIEITISEADLGRAEPEFGITKDDLKLFDDDGAIRIKVFVDGEPADLARATARSIIVKAPPRPDGGPFTVVVVTANDGKLLNVLECEGNEKIPVEDLTDDESNLIKVIQDATNRIVAAITSQKGAGRPPRQG